MTQEFSELFFCENIDFEFGVWYNEYINYRFSKGGNEL